MASVLTLLCVVAVATVLPSSVTGDFNSGCPQWGCLTGGSFALSARVPQVVSSTGPVTWSTTIESLNGTDTQEEYERGCVSNQEFVVCTTQRGYVSLDPKTGAQLWNYTSMPPPFLPDMDIYGDIIGMSKEALVAVANDGTAKHPIGIKIMHPKYGLMISNNSKIFLTASLTKTAQVFTYDTAGIIDAAYQLRGSRERMNGTFVPCSHPVIGGNRVYLISRFVPDKGDPKRTSQWLTLHAIDLLSQMAPRIWSAWNVSLEMETDPLAEARGEEDATQDPIVTFFNNTIYVNRQFPQTNRIKPLPLFDGSLYAFRDMGTYGERLFKVDSNYGPMAVYDTFDAPIKHARGQELNMVWAAAKGSITGYNSWNGTVMMTIDCAKVASITSITSRITVTRQAAATRGDVLVFGGVDDGGDAYVVTVMADPTDGSVKLMWKVHVCKPTSQLPASHCRVVGQIVNTAQPKPHSGLPQDPPNVMYGVIATVVEAGPAGNHTHIKAIYDAQ